MQDSYSINWNKLFVELSKEFWDPLFRFCVSLKKNRINAEDLHQTSMLKALSSFSRFVSHHHSSIQNEEDVHILFARPDVKNHFKNWLYKIVKNTFLDQKDSEKKWQFDESYDALNNVPSLQQGFLEGGSLQTKQSKAALANEKEFYNFALDDQWKERLEQLNEKQKSILYLIAEDYSYKEIASILDIPTGTVMSSLSRALQKLKQTPQPV